MLAIAIPVKAFAVPRGGIEYCPKLYYSSFGAVSAEDACHKTRCDKARLGNVTFERLNSVPFSLRNTPHLATTIGI